MGNCFGRRIKLNGDTLDWGNPTSVDHFSDFNRSYNRIMSGSDESDHINTSANAVKFIDELNQTFIISYSNLMPHLNSHPFPHPILKKPMQEEQATFIIGNVLLNWDDGISADYISECNSSYNSI